MGRVMAHYNLDSVEMTVPTLGARTYMLHCKIWRALTYHTEIHRSKHRMAPCAQHTWLLGPVMLTMGHSMYIYAAQ